MTVKYVIYLYTADTNRDICKTRMWADAQRDGRRVKFGRNRSKRGHDNGDFSIFQDGGCLPLDLLCVCLDHPQRAFGGLYRCAKLHWNRCSSFDNMHVFLFREFVLKTPPKIVFLWGGDFTPKWGAILTEPPLRNYSLTHPKSHILARVRVV